MKLLTLSQAVSALEGDPLLSESQSTIEIIRSISTRTEFEFHLSSSEFCLLNQNYQHFMAEFKFSNDMIVGHGRDILAERAMAKSVYELVERVAMVSLKNYPVPRKLSALWQSDKISILDERPQNELYGHFATSNGWAAGSDLERTIRSALFESLERHFLQVAYWKDHFSSWLLHQTLVQDSFEFKFWSMRTSYRNLVTLIVTVAAKNFPGLTFGHSCRHLGEQEFNSLNYSLEHWKHPLIEGLQSAQMNLESSGIQSDNIFENIGRQFAFDVNIKSLLPTSSSSSSSSCGTEFSDEIQFNLQVFELSEFLGVKVPVFAVKSWSDSILPIYLERAFTPKELQLFAEQCKSIGIPFKLTQTPFV